MADNNTTMTYNDLHPTDISWGDYYADNNIGLSKYEQKLLNTTINAEQMTALTEKLKLNKQLDIDGFQIVPITLTDADSSDDKIALIDGQPKKIRFVDVNDYDALDSKKPRERNPVKNQIQLEHASRILGKSIDELAAGDPNDPTKEHPELHNLKNYQFQRALNYFKPNTELQAYDPNTIYPDLPPQEVLAAVKIVGYDERYDRYLVEAINPETGRQVSFDMSNDPYLNMRFQISKSIDSPQNRKRVQDYLEGRNPKLNYKPLEERLYSIKEKFDDDGRFGELGDIIESNWLQTKAKWANHFIPDSWLSEETKKEYKKLADPEIGQAFADAIAGVKTSTRREYAKTIAGANEDIRNGDYVSAILKYGSAIPELIAESAIQTTAAGAASLIPYVGPVIGGLLIGTDETLSVIDDYKAEHGVDMPNSEKLKTFAGHFALAVPETLLAKTGIGGIFSSVLKKPLQAAYKAAPIKEAFKATSKAALGETGQEWGQNTWSEFMKNPDKKGLSGFIDTALEPEQQGSAIAGGLMGGAITGGLHALGLPFRIRGHNKQEKINTQRKEIENKLTVEGKAADQTLSTDLNTQVDKITVSDPTSFKETGAAIRSLATLLSNNISSINIATANKITTKQTELA